jgi:hypothetical protein
MNIGAPIYTVEEQIKNIQKKREYVKPKESTELTESKKSTDSRYWLVGSFGFEYMSRRADKIIFDKVTNKYYLHEYNNKIHEIKYDDIINDMNYMDKMRRNNVDNKDIQNSLHYRSSYSLFDKKYHRPVSIVKSCGSFFIEEC